MIWNIGYFNEEKEKVEAVIRKEEESASKNYLRLNINKIIFGKNR